MNTLVEFRPDKAALARRRRIMGRALRAALDTHGSELAGFALVSWDRRGGAHTTYLAQDGMVSESLMPTLVHDALNRHVAVVLAEREASRPLDDDA